MIYVTLSIQYMYMYLLYFIFIAFVYVKKKEKIQMFCLHKYNVYLNFSVTKTEPDLDKTYEMF